MRPARIGGVASQLKPPGVSPGPTMYFFFFFFFLPRHVTCGVFPDQVQSEPPAPGGRGVLAAGEFSAVYFSESGGSDFASRCLSFLILCIIDELLEG